jgi:plasmid stability protein
MPTLQVRNLPDHIYRKIVERAKAKRSSITSETIYLLQRSLEMDENKRERRLALVKAMEEKQSADVKNLPDPVDLIRSDRDR